MSPSRNWCTIASDFLIFSLLFINFLQLGLYTCLRIIFNPARRKVFQEVDVPNTSNKKSIIVYVPVPQLRQFQKIQPRLVRELEKKFSGKHVVFIARVKWVPLFPGLHIICMNEKVHKWSNEKYVMDPCSEMQKNLIIDIFSRTS